MRRFALYFLPAIAAAAVIFGLFYAWVGIQSFRHGDGSVALFLMVFGFGGIALGVAMWTTWRNIVRHRVKDR